MSTLMSPGRCDELIYGTGLVPGSQKPLCLLLPSSPLCLLKIFLGYIHVRINFHKGIESHASCAPGIGLRKEGNRDPVLGYNSQHKILWFPRPFLGSLQFLCPEARASLTWTNPVGESGRVLPLLSTWACLLQKKQMQAAHY